MIAAWTCPSAELGGKGVFVKEVQAAVLDGRADVAVHSAKDLPAVTLRAWSSLRCPRRADPRDALVGVDPGGAGARGAGGHRVRRAAGPSWPGCGPDLTFAGLRGNIDTRLGQGWRSTGPS